jgi:hypothetical protein
VNLEEARIAVEQRGFDYLSAPRIYVMLNAAKDTFEDVYDWPWLHGLTAGATPLTIPDLKLMRMVKTTTANDELLGLDARQAAMSMTNLAQAGTPEYWWLEGDQKLHVWPGDGAGVNVYYTRDSPALVLPADTPLIPARYHPLWIDYAVVEAYKDSDNYAAAQALRADIGYRLQDVIGRYETRNRQHSSFMTVRDFHEDD